MNGWSLEQVRALDPVEYEWLVEELNKQGTEPDAVPDDPEWP